MLRHEIEDGELDDEDDVNPSREFSILPRNGPHPDSDSDEEFTRRIFEKPKTNVATSEKHHFEEKIDIPAKRRRCKTKNNIWSNVVADQMLSGDLTNWSGIEEAKARDRDVESYDYSKAKDDLRPECLYQEMLYSDKMNKESSADNFDPDTIETFGTANMGPKGIKRRLGNQVGKGIKERLGERTFDKSKERMHINVCENSAEEDVVDELLKLLGEPESMKSTFHSIVSTIGVPRSLELLKITEDTEDAGGILTLDSSRRRSPGGVYLFLLKSKTSSEERNLIFPINNNSRRKMKASRSKNHQTDTVDKTWELPQDKGNELDNKMQDLVERSQAFIAGKCDELNGFRNKDSYEDKDMDINVTVYDDQRLVNKLNVTDKSNDKINESNLDIELDFI